ncbi:MAG TPA: superoxide dismutase family protein [Burkholderiales bacterium]|jgi:Cu-Zn family superoxide dismutase|nr:superoxide dismutase family protein [Burkholderiales bacterium]
MKASFGIGCALLLAACATTPQATGPSANAVMRPASGSQVHGDVTLTETGNSVRINAELAALPTGLVTLRIHEKGDCSAPDAASAGVLERELGPLQPDEYGKSIGSYTITGTSLTKNSGGLLGKGMVVQQGKDRIACGTIQ